MTKPIEPKAQGTSDELDQPALDLDKARRAVSRKLLADDGHIEYGCEIELFGSSAWRIDWLREHEEGTAILLPRRPHAHMAPDWLERELAEEFARVAYKRGPFSIIALGRHWSLLTTRSACLFFEPEPGEAGGDDPGLSPGVAPARTEPPPGLGGEKEERPALERIPLALLAEDFQRFARPPGGRLIMRRLLEVNFGRSEHLSEPGRGAAVDGKGCPLGHALELAWETEDEDGYRLILRKRELRGFPIDLLRTILSMSRPGLTLLEGVGEPDLLVFERRISCVNLSL